jgi:preprotein translocase subunit YajC
LILAQQNQPPLPGAGNGTVETPSNSGVTGTATPSGTATGTGAGTPAPGPNPMLLIIVLVAAMLVFTLWSSRREKKKRDTLINAIKKHDRVQTIGGVIGSVVEVKPDYVVLKVDESSNTRITFARAAIQQVLTSSPEIAPKEPT